MKYFTRYRSPKDYTMPEDTVASYIHYKFQAIIVNSISGSPHCFSPPVTNELLNMLVLNKWEI